MFYTLAQAAEALGTTEDHVKRLAADGKVRTFQDGASLLFKISEINALKGEIKPLAAETPTESEEALALEAIDLEDEPLDLESSQEDASVSELEALLGLGATDESGPEPVEMADEPLDFEYDSLDLEPEAAGESPSGLEDLLDLTLDEEAPADDDNKAVEPQSADEPLDLEPASEAEPSSEMDELMSFNPTPEEAGADEPVEAGTGEFDELIDLEPSDQEQEAVEPEELMELEAGEELPAEAFGEAVGAADEGLEELMEFEPAAEDAESSELDDQTALEAETPELTEEDEEAAAVEGADLDDLLDIGPEVGAAAEDSLGLEESASPMDAYNDDSVAGPIETGELPATDDTAEDILLAPETGISLDADLTNADTAISGAGVKVLGESDADYELTDDTLGETAAPGRTSPEASLEEIEEDVNLDTFGSGSGLLDLSLQADDTSLGGILDEIYTAEDEAAPAMPAATAESTAEEMEAEADQIMADEDYAAPQAAAALPAMMAMPAAQIVYDDKANKVSSILMILTLPFIVYAALAAGLGVRGTGGRAVELTQNYMMYVAGGVSLLLAVIGLTMFMGGGSGQPKVKKEKKAKETKAKKGKVKKESKPKKQK